jgi:hypothetical protein
VNNRETDVVGITLYISIGLIVAAAGALGFLEWKTRGWQEEVKGIKKSMVAIGKDADSIDTLLKELAEDKLNPTAGVQAYIESQAKDAQITSALGIKKPQVDPHRDKGFQDQSFEVEIKRQEAIDRQRLARFLHLIQYQTFRVKPTKINIQQDEKRTDLWAGTITVTQRQSLAEKKPATK